MPAEITTVILFFNKPALTRRCLASVKRAGAAGQVILVDNGSKTQKPGPDLDGVFVVRLEINQGFARGMNAGIRAASEQIPPRDWVLLLSNDVELPDDFYARLADATSELSPDTAVILCPRVFFLSDRSKPAYTHGHLDIATGKLSHHDDTSIAEIRFPDYYPAAATIWSRAAIARLGGFDESYFCYWEDVELAHRTALLGVTLLPVPGLKIHHLGRGTTGGKRVYSEYFRRGQELTLARVAGHGVQ